MILPLELVQKNYIKNKILAYRCLIKPENLVSESAEDAVGFSAGASSSSCLVL